ncbi:MAG: hypothetical protein P9X24_10520 [Candidatus Hatepunaea meridiana]|nr:hypothetical protein [Candidatus Hatepunaea meridiana]
MIENDLQFDFSKALKPARRFDDENHGLSHCMKAVDFIIELNDKILFIEVKDPQHPRVSKEELTRFLAKLKSKELVNKELIPKCRDSFLYEYAMNNLGKPVFYYVLIAIDALTKAELFYQTDILRKHIPVEGIPENPWQNRFIEGCMVMNIDTWNLYLPEYPVSRISEQLTSLKPVNSIS